MDSTTRPSTEPDFSRKLERVISLYDHRRVVTLRDAADVVNEMFAACRTQECWVATRLLIEAAKTGESADIAYATATTERLLHDRGMLSGQHHEDERHLS